MWIYIETAVTESEHWRHHFTVFSSEQSLFLKTMQFKHTCMHIYTITENDNIPSLASVPGFLGGQAGVLFRKTAPEARDAPWLLSVAGDLPEPEVKACPFVMRPTHLSGRTKDSKAVDMTHFCLWSSHFCFLSYYRGHMALLLPCTYVCMHIRN